MTAQMCKALSAIGVDDSRRFGSKATMLGELSKSGFEVPEGFALPVECFASFLHKSQFPYQPGDYAAYSSEIRECLQAYPLPQELLESSKRCVEKLRSEYPPDTIIVRTSALCEDSQSSSMAGVFESFPGLRSPQEVGDAVRGCYVALFSDGVIDRHAAGLIADHELRAGVVIQRYVAGDISGVTFTADAKEMNPSRIIISAVRGPCSGLTSGSRTSTT